jgi:hypothetical protein
MKKFIITILFFILTTSLCAQDVLTNSNRDYLVESKEMNLIAKKPGHYTAAEWGTLIDSTWGEGLPTENKLDIFDRYWNAVDAYYPGFINLDVDWDSLRNVYRPEVEAGVSQGRFAAIMNQLAMALEEIHTHCNNATVREDSLLPGVPLMVYGAAYQVLNQGHFGAALTPLPDSSALVFKVVDNHPLDLVPGDIVLGYDGVPWKYLYQQLLDAELPNTFPYYINVGSSERSVSHMWLMSAGLNWHLFDTIDILKYGTNDTLHLPTSNLINQNMNLFSSEQLPVSGVPMLDLSRFWELPMVSWGIVDNTQIGYIYVSRWRELEQPAFTNAVDSLLDNYQTTGLILDFRMNPGGRSDMANGGYRRLFNSDIEVFEYAARSDPDDHFALEHVPDGFCSGQTFRFHADPYLYDKPIAILTGPMTFSAAEFNALRVKYHPMTRTFGKPTNGGFTCFYQTFHNVSIPYAGWEAGYAPHNVFLVDDPDNYIMHVGSKVDEEIWLTQEDVAKGEDSVVKRAIEWIQNLSYAHDVEVNKLYVKPGADSVKVTALVENPNENELSVTMTIRNQDSTITDQQNLFDDGLHGDGDANDNLWGNFYLPTPDKEELYKVSVTTDDLTDETSRTLPNVDWLTTIGPIKIDHYDIISSDTIPNHGDRIGYRLTLRNEGQFSTAPDVRAKIIVPDSCATIISPERLFGDIEPGSTAENSVNFSIIFGDTIEGCANPMTLQFLVEISSDGFVFWHDTLEIIVTDIENDKLLAVPKSFALHQNYPNPFNPVTMINYQLPMINDVDLSIYNVLGQKVATLVSERTQAGHHQVEWDASGFASGVYYYRIEAGEFIDIKKMVLLR